jgi:LCP family protein required for cell wall assembly
MTGVGLHRRHRRAVVTTIVATQLVVALVTGLVITVAYDKLDKNFSEGQNIVHKVHKKHLIGGDPLNILVMGSDSRVGAGNDIDGQTGIGARSDTTILVHVSADRKTVYGVSLPRDAMVTRPECTSKDGKTIPGAKDQIFNAAYSLGGPACTAAQVESLTGLYIDHYVSIDFNGFKDMVDAVHGVNVCIPEDVNDTAHHITLKAGTQQLDGQQALNYVRERYALSSNSDIGRMKRQQAFIASMINKVVSAGTLTRPSRVYNFLKAATASIVTDPGLSSLGKLVKLSWQFRKTSLHDISFITVPFEEYPPDPNRLQWSPDAKGLWKVILNDKPLPKKYKEEVISANKPPGTPTHAASGPASAATSSSSTASPSSPPSSSPTSPSGSTGSGPQKADQNGLCA